MVFVDVQAPETEPVAESPEQLKALLGSDGGQQRWLRKPDVQKLMLKGIHLATGQCYGFKVPFVLSASANEPYVADIYEYVPFLGDFHRQLQDVPDGEKVIVKVKR